MVLKSRLLIYLYQKTMIHSHTLRCMFALFLLGFLANCQISMRTPHSKLLTYFKTSTVADTLHIEVLNEAPESGDTIPNHVFFTSLPAALLQQIDYLADSSSAVVLSRQQFPIDDNISAFWVEIHQAWFLHHSLFLYNKSKRQFTDRITVAEWFGGDGSQVLIGSWVFDYDGDGKKDLVVRDIQHSMVPNGDEDPIEETNESACLLLWKNGRFMDTSFQDTTAMVLRFPIRSFW